VGNFLTSCKPVSFSRRTLHHAVSSITIAIKYCTVILLAIYSSAVVFIFLVEEKPLPISESTLALGTSTFLLVFYR